MNLQVTSPQQLRLVLTSLQSGRLFLLLMKSAQEAAPVIAVVRKVVCDKFKVREIVLSK